ncbi:glycosyltransferase [Ruoffia sp. FAM 24228]|uniref:glycosyltransferase n=1 Tax=Ruoffia sp. FAM 24228 TaxID=3259517 RepID=UPI0038890A38
MEKKILFLVSSVGTTGGIQKNLSMISDELIKSGYKVSILSIFKYDQTYYKFNSKIEMYSCQIKPTKDIKKQFISVYRSTNRMLKKINFDQLIIEGTGYATTVSKNWFLNKDVIVIDHEGLQFHSPFGLSRWGAKISVKYARAIRLLTNLSKNEYISAFPKANAQLITIYNPISNLIQEQKYNVESKKILYVGRLDAEKGINYLIDAVGNLKKNDKFDRSWSLDIYGDGDQKKDIKLKIEEYNLQGQVKLKGFKNNIHELYSDYSFLVLPSMYESFGLVIVEALKSGIPVVAFDSLYGPKEIIKNNVNGILVERKNIGSLSNAIFSLIKSNELRRYLGSNTQKELERYNINQILEQWIAMIENREA